MNDGFIVPILNVGTNWIGWDGFPNWNGWSGWALPPAEQIDNGEAMVPAGGRRKAKKITPVNVE